MNLIDIYPCTSQKLYLFQAVENRQNNNYNVAIYKWSDSQKKHIFEDHLSPQTYIDMLEEPDMLFESLFENDKNQDRNLINILQKNAIKTIEHSDSNGSYHDRMKASIYFPDKTEADQCVNLLHKIFRYMSP